jgi:hypothetical protein
MASDCVTPEPRRFSIRLAHWCWFLLVTVVLVAGAIGLSVWLPWHRERLVTQKIEDWGGLVGTDTGGPEWLRRLVGETHLKKRRVLEQVTGVTFVDSKRAQLSLKRISL